MVNRVKYIYRMIIMLYMMREEAHLFYHKFVKPESIWNTPQTYGPHLSLPQSVSKLYRAIRNAGYKEITPKTVRRHLKKMVREALLIKLPKERRHYNETLYILNPKRMGEYALWYTGLVGAGLERGHFSSYFGYTFLGGSHPFSRLTYPLRP